MKMCSYSYGSLLVAQTASTGDRGSCRRRDAGLAVFVRISQSLDQLLVAALQCAQIYQILFLLASVFLAICAFHFKISSIYFNLCLQMCNLILILYIFCLELINVGTRDL